MTGNLGIYILMALGVLTLLDIVVIYKSNSGNHDTKYFVGWLLLLAFLITCFAVLTGDRY